MLSHYVARLAWIYIRLPEPRIEPSVPAKKSRAIIEAQTRKLLGTLMSYNLSNYG